MLRGSNDDHFTAKHNTSSFVVASTVEGEKQKKKRLSFKEPEIEPRQIGGHKSTAQGFKSSFISKTKITQQEDDKNLNELTLEDQALQIVKHVGQAFVSPHKSLEYKDRISSILPVTELTRESFVESRKKVDTTSEHLSEFKSITKHSPSPDKKISEKIPLSSTHTAMRCPIIQIATEDGDKTAGAEEPEEGSQSTRDAEHMSTAPKLLEVDPCWPTAARHQIQMLNFRLEQQRQQTKTAMSQIQLFKDQLEAERSARYQAQVQNQQLMNQNKDLVDQIQQLFKQIQDLEKQIESCKKSTDTQPQESKQVSLSAPASGYRRNSGTLWPTLNPAIMGRRNSATLSPTPLQNDPSQKLMLSDSLNRRTSITEDLAAISSIAKFSSATDWRLRRRGSSNLNFDFPTKTKINNGFSTIDDPSPSPSIDRTKITPLFSPEPKRSITSEIAKPLNESQNATASSSKTSSLIIDESPALEYNSTPNLWSSRSFKPIDPDRQRVSPTYKNQNKDSAAEKQLLITKSLETLRLFNS